MTPAVGTGGKAGGAVACTGVTGGTTAGAAATCGIGAGNGVAATAGAGDSCLGAEVGGADVSGRMTAGTGAGGAGGAGAACAPGSANSAMGAETIRSGSNSTGLVCETAAGVTTDLGPPVGAGAAGRTTSVAAGSRVDSGLAWSMGCACHRRNGTSDAARVGLTGNGLVSDGASDSAAGDANGAGFSLTGAGVRNGRASLADSTGVGAVPGVGVRVCVGAACRGRSGDVARGSVAGAMASGVTVGGWSPATTTGASETVGVVGSNSTSACGDFAAGSTD